MDQNRKIVYKTSGPGNPGSIPGCNIRLTGGVPPHSRSYRDELGCGPSKHSLIRQPKHWQKYDVKCFKLFSWWFFVEPIYVPWPPVSTARWMKKSKNPKIWNYKRKLEKNGLIDYVARYRRKLWKSTEGHRQCLKLKRSRPLLSYMFNTFDIVSFHLDDHNEWI